MSTQRTSMLGQAGKFLTNDGQLDSWQPLPVATPATVTAANNGTSLNGTTVELGNIAGATTSVLTSAREIPTAGFNLFMSGTGRLGIGRNANQAPQALLHVGAGSTTGAVSATAIILGTPNASANIGNFSVNAGSDNRTVGNFNFAAGQLNNIYVNNGVTFGAANTLGVIGQDPQTTGRESFAAGFSNTVRGTNSGSIGNQCTVNGNTSFAVGFQCQANDTGTFASGNLAVSSGAFSLSMGDGTLSSGVRSQSFGLGTISQGQQQMSLGLFNKGSGNNSGTFVANDTLLVIGNGIISARKNAFSVQFDGAIQMQNNALAGALIAPNDPTMSAVVFKDNVRFEWNTATSVWIRRDGQLEFADNAAAIAGGLPIGTFYRTGDLLKVVRP